MEKNDNWFHAQINDFESMLIGYNMKMINVAPNFGTTKNEFGTTKKRDAYNPMQK